ncbi:MAG: hypothetical protein ACM3SS_24015 [Rhodospirillaceae bacterium]
MLRSLRLFALAALLGSASTALAETHAIPPDLWDRPRSARAIMDHPAIQQAVRTYLAQAGRRLVIHYPAGQEPLLYAEELRSWLIALAVNGDDIMLRPDRNRGEPLTLEVLP